MRREGIQGTSNEKRERGVGAVGGEWRKMRGNAVKEHYSQNSCSCVIYLVDGAQSKCKRKFDLCFTLSCELVGILPNLKSWKLSTAHMPGR